MERRWVGSSAYRAAIAALVNARQNCGVSQRELARRLGKHPSFINKIEKLERRLDVVETVAIALALGMEPAKLMSEIQAALPPDLEV